MCLDFWQTATAAMVGAVAWQIARTLAAILFEVAAETWALWQLTKSRPGE